MAVLTGMCCFLYMCACRPLSHMRRWSYLRTNNVLIERAHAGRAFWHGPLMQMIWHMGDRTREVASFPRKTLLPFSPVCVVSCTCGPADYVLICGGGHIENPQFPYWDGGCGYSILARSFNANNLTNMRWNPASGLIPPLWYYCGSRRYVKITVPLISADAGVVTSDNPSFPYWEGGYRLHHTGIYLIPARTTLQEPGDTRSNRMRCNN